MTATYYASNNILNYEFGLSSFSGPNPNWYLGLSTTTPSISGSNFTEPTDVNYTRIAVANSHSAFSTSTAGSIVNLGTLNFPQSSGSWGTISFVGFFNASASSTNHLYHYYALTNPVVISASSVFSLLPGTIGISFA